MISSILQSQRHPSGEGRQKIYQLSDCEGGGSSKSDLVIRGSHAAFMYHSPLQNDGGERKDSTKTSCYCERRTSFTRYTEMGAIKTALTLDQTDGVLEGLGMEQNITTAVYHLWAIHILNTQCWQFPTSKMYNWKGSEEDQR